jgi:hypothetical protein
MEADGTKRDLHNGFRTGFQGPDWIPSTTLITRHMARGHFMFRGLIIQLMPCVGRYVFPSDHADEHQPFLPNALTNCINRTGFNGTMHGMRTTFRNWGGESVEHNFRREVLEHCLSHRVGDDSEKSYWTADMVERRRVALQAWADYVKPPKMKRPKLTLVA